jgi:hypothetical protein
MRAQFRLADLIPCELNVDRVCDVGDIIIVAAHGRQQIANARTAEPPRVVFIAAILG